MSTVATFIESARYDLLDYQEGIVYDDRELYVFLNRMIKIIDSQLAALKSELIHGIEIDVDTVADQNYVDLSSMNNGHWDSLRSVWIGSDRKQQISLDLLYYKRKFRSGSAEPEYWSYEDKRLLWEVDADAAHTDLVIHYNKKTRPRLQSWSDTFTASASTDIITLASGNHTFVTGDGPFTVSNSGGALPTGLTAGTNYYCILDPDDLDGMKLATSIANAIDGTSIDLTAAGSGTQTITLGDDLMPFDGRFDDVIREMLVLHSKLKKEGQVGGGAGLYEGMFRKRAMEETIRRRTIFKNYSIDF